MIIDTDVLIWFLRGNAKAAIAVREVADPSVSIITYMELIKGCRNTKEAQAVKSFFADYDIHNLPVSDAISNRAAYLVEEYASKVDMGIADSLIAATALEKGMSLLTGNARHFRPIKNLEVKHFRP